MAVVGAGGGSAHTSCRSRCFGARVVGLDTDDRKLAALENLGSPIARSGPIASVDAARLWPDGPPTCVVDLVGTPETLDPRAMVFRETSVLASRYANRAEPAAAADLMATGRLRPVIGAVAQPADVLDLHAELRAGTLLGRGALRWL